MADAAKKKKPTHTAFAMKRLGRRFVRWLEIGSGRQNADGSFQAFLDRTPLGGWTGAVYFAPIGSPPPEPPPERTAQTAGDDEEQQTLFSGDDAAEPEPSQDQD
jgi:hypothetical protein